MLSWKKISIVNKMTVVMGTSYSTISTTARTYPAHNKHGTKCEKAVSFLFSQETWEEASSDVHHSHG